MDNELLIEFEGCTKDRDEFLSQIHQPIDEFVTDGIHVNAMLMFFREMVKNIYDHALGMGKMSLVREMSGIRFRIEDFGNKSYDFNILKVGRSSKAGNGINYGIGLGLIESMAESLQIVDFKIDCSKGFIYSGVYPYERHETHA